MIQPRAKEVRVDPLSWHHAFGWSVYLLVGIVIAMGLIGRLVSFFSYKLAARRAASNEDLPVAEHPAARKQGLWSTVCTYYCRFISVPATFGRHHMRPVGGGWFSVPTRLQALMIFAYVAINIIFSFTDYRVVEGKTPKAIQLGKQIGDRAGIMAFYNFPLLFALAGRNDILIWITGWSYRSMNLFHRWVGRMSILHAIVHSAAYTWLNRGKLATKFQTDCWACGIFATVFLCLIIPLACRPFRTRFYEIFLITHIILAIAVLVLLFFHVKVMSGAYNAWLWACVGIWAFDRLIRFLRIALLSFRTLKVSGEGRNAVARIADPESGLIRLSVDSSVALNPTAGAYYFLYTPWSSTPWQSHPFSLASWEPSASGSGTTLHFLVAPRGGATRRLQQRIAKSSQANDRTGSPSHEVSLRVLLEGPYGHRHPVERFDSVLLVAGGTGITAMLPYVFDLARRGHKNVSVAWIVKDRSYADDVLARELSDENRGLVNVNVFVSSSGKLVRLDTEEKFQSMGEKDPKVIDDSSSDGHSDESISSATTVCNTPSRVGTPASSPIEGKHPFSVNAVDKKLMTGDLMAHLVMKNKFLGADSRSASFSSNTSLASTACDTDDADTVGGSTGAKKSADSISSSGHSTSSSTSTLRFIPGRPAMRMLVNRSLDQLVGDQRLAIMGCGPWSMMDDLRATIAESYGTRDGQVSARQLEYFEDAFEW